MYTESYWHEHLIRIEKADVAGFEPAIPGLGGRCIIQLCYTPG